MDICTFIKQSKVLCDGNTAFYSDPTNYSINAADFAIFYAGINMV